MSNSIIGALRVNLGLDSAQFSKGVKKAQTDMQKLGASMQKIGAAVSVAGAAIAATVRGQLNAADEMGKAAQRIGLPVEALSQLRYAADLSGVSVGQLEAGIKRLSQGMAQRAGEFAGLGIAVRDTEGFMRPTVDVLTDFADVLSKMPDGAQKTALVMRFLGEDAASLIPLLNGGGEALRGMMQESDSLGRTITGPVSDAAAQFNDALTKLRTAVAGIATQIAGELAPVLARVAQTVADVAAGFAKLSPEARTFGAALAGIGIAAGPVLIAVGTLIRSLAALRLGLAAFGGPVGIAAALLGAAAVAMLGFRQRSEESKAPLDEAKVAVSLLNEAMGTFASAASPSAQAAALNNAVAYRDQAAAAIQAAEAEVALMEAELARFRSAPVEERGLLTGDMEAGAMERNIAAAQGEIDSMRRSLDLARVRIRQAAGEITSSMGPAMIEGSEATEKLKLELEGVDGVLGRISSGGGGGSAAAAVSGISGLSAATAGVRDFAAQMTDAFGNAFSSVISGAQSARDALRGLLQQLSSMLANQAFQMLAQGLFGGSKSTGGGELLKGLVGAFGGFRANGGPVSAGRAYVVGERGPELFVPSMSGGIIPSGGGGMAHVELVVRNEPGTLVDVVRTESVKVTRAGLLEYDRAVLPSSMRRISNDPRRKG